MAHGRFRGRSFCGALRPGSLVRPRARRGRGGWGLVQSVKRTQFLWEPHGSRRRIIASEPTMRTLTLFVFATGILSAQSGDWLIISSDMGALNYLRAELTFQGDKITGRAGGNVTVEGTM